MVRMFNPGDAVKLKSGDPLMTVVSLQQPPRSVGMPEYTFREPVQALWFNRDGNPTCGFFEAVCLVSATVTT